MTAAVRDRLGEAKEVAALIDAARSGRGRCVSQRKEISFSVLLSNHRRRPSGSTTS